MIIFACLYLGGYFSSQPYVPSKLAFNYYQTKVHLMFIRLHATSRGHLY